jgi:hypothetical protein
MPRSRLRMTQLASQTPAAPAANDLAAVRAATLNLLAYCQANDWAGYDPYDALNSKVYEAMPFLHFRAARLALSQLLKRSPVNLRPLLLVPKTQNPKGLALFISALLRLWKLELIPDETPIRELLARLTALRSKDKPNWCWGYPFPWQARAALFPRWIPNIICTTFAGNALLDAFDRFQEPELLGMAVSAADFLLGTLYHEEGPSAACFSYMPLARSKVHNANLLGSAFLCRVAGASGDPKYLPPALKAAAFSVARQHPDGSWDYGESDNPPQRWKDNFHTGFNLCALQAIARFAGTDRFADSTGRGLAYFRQHFFADDGAPKYFHDATYPIDVHSAAQSMITLAALRDQHPENLSLAQSVCRWALANLRAEQGYFYFQKHPLYTNRIPYMRWSQAWMLLALSALLEARSQPVPDPRAPQSAVDASEAVMATTALLLA